MSNATILLVFFTALTFAALPTTNCSPHLKSPAGTTIFNFTPATTAVIVFPLVQSGATVVTGMEAPRPRSVTGVPSYPAPAAAATDDINRTEPITNIAPQLRFRADALRLSLEILAIPDPPNCSTTSIAFS